MLVTENVEYVDYKDVDLLQRFVSDRSKIRNRRVTGNTLQQQREVANAVKNAREMALLPYAKRVASHPYRSVAARVVTVAATARPRGSRRGRRDEASSRDRRRRCRRQCRRTGGELDGVSEEV